MSNPNMVVEVLRREKGCWLPRVRDTVSTDPAWCETDQAVRFDSLASNIQIRFPATSAGITRLEEATA